MFRDRKTVLRYRRFRKTWQVGSCDFCDLPEHQIVETRKHIAIIKNLFPYSVYDFCRVIDHKMIIPRKHTGVLGEYSPEMLKEYAEALAEYEERGYVTITRGQDNVGRSMAHHHTHLIRVDNKPLTWMAYLARPYLFFGK